MKHLCSERANREVSREIAIKYECALNEKYISVKQLSKFRTGECSQRPLRLLSFLVETLQFNECTAVCDYSRCSFFETIESIQHISK